MYLDSLFDGAVEFDASVRKSEAVIQQTMHMTLKSTTQLMHVLRLAASDSFDSLDAVCL
jgi:hypothetical protein